MDGKMYKIFYLFLISASIVSVSLISKTSTSNKRLQEKFDGISKATKPKNGLKLFS